MCKKYFIYWIGHQNSIDPCQRNNWDSKIDSRNRPLHFVSSFKGVCCLKCVCCLKWDSTFLPWVSENKLEKYGSVEFDAYDCSNIQTAALRHCRCCRCLNDGTISKAIVSLFKRWQCLGYISKSFTGQHHGIICIEFYASGNIELSLNACSCHVWHQFLSDMVEWVNGSSRFNAIILMGIAMDNFRACSNIAWK